MNKFERPEMSPSEARRRLATELRELRESAKLTGKDAGTTIELSAATISRMERNTKALRWIEVSALLDLYLPRLPALDSVEVRDRLEHYFNESRRTQWFEPFKDVTKGEMTPKNIITVVEYEVDATEIRNFESDLVPGLLQTEGYAVAVAEVFFPRRSHEDHLRFAQFRIARQVAVTQAESSRQLFVVVSEMVLRRMVGSPAVHREQMAALLGHIRGESQEITVHVVSDDVVIPAALGGPFIVLSLPNDGDIVYLESRSGGDYLTSEQDVERFRNYFEQLCDAAMSREDAIVLVERVMSDLPGDQAGQG